MTPNPTTPAPTTEEWNPDDPRCVRCHVALFLEDGCEWSSIPQCNLCGSCAIKELESHYAAAHPADQRHTNGVAYRAQIDTLTTALAEANERAAYLLKCNTDLNTHVRDLSEQLRKERVALAEAKARCAELTEKLTNTMDARNVAWLDLAHIKARAETAEARCAEMEKERDEITSKHDEHRINWGVKLMLATNRALAAEAERDRMKAALQGVLNSAVHPDIALRAVMVDLSPVRAALNYANNGTK